MRWRLLAHLCTHACANHAPASDTFEYLSIHDVVAYSLEDEESLRTAESSTISIGQTRKANNMAKNESPEPFYSMSRRAGDMLFLSGFGPVKDGEVVGSGIEEQTIFTMNAMKVVLESGGATWDQAVRVNVFLLDMADRDGFNATYMKYFKDRHHMPTRRLIGAGDMYMGILVEIDAVAYLGDD